MSPPRRFGSVREPKTTIRLQTAPVSPQAFCTAAPIPSRSRGGRRRLVAAVFMAAANGKAQILKAMLDAGTAVSGSYIWWAAKLGKASTVKVLLAHGNFDLAFAKDKKTIVQAAWHAGLFNRTMRKRAMEIVNMLREAGAPDELPDVAPGPVYGSVYNS